MKTSNNVEVLPTFTDIYCHAKMAADDGAKGSVFDPIEVMELVEYASRAEAQVAALRLKPEDVPVRCSYCGEQICVEKDWDAKVLKHMSKCEKNPLTRFLKKIAALQWQPITPETEIPAKFEIGGWAEREFCITECEHGSTGKNLLPVWTHFRPINPPTQDKPAH